MAKIKLFTRSAMRKFVVRASVAFIALMSGFISYGHIKAVALAAGENRQSSSMLPLIIDLTMIVSSILVFDDRRLRRRPRIYARMGQIIGLVTSIAANLTDAVIRHGAALAIATAVAPAVFLFVTSESLMHSGVPLPKAPLSAAQKKKARERQAITAARARLNTPVYAGN